MKILKSKKALSPVVASIILIAVTVAVSIAVAAWMGALTFTFTNTEQITFTGYSWATPVSGRVPYMLITVKNTGSADLSIAEVRVDGVTANHNGTFPAPVVKGSSVILNITRTTAAGGQYYSGTQYSFMIITAKGNQFGPYTQTAP
jgi:flagellin-like protein